MKNSHMAGIPVCCFSWRWPCTSPCPSKWKDYVLIASSLFTGYFIAIKVIKAFRMKAFSIELLVTIAVIGALIIGEYVDLP